MTDWIQWTGDTKPPIKDGVPFLVRIRSGDELNKPVSDASSWRWSHTGDGGDIVAYKVISHDHQ